MSRKSSLFRRGALPLLAAAPIAFALLAAGPPPTDKTDQRGFDSPTSAVDALVAAARAYDVTTLRAILGPHSEDLVETNDPVQDKARAEKFAAEAAEKKSVEVDPANPHRAKLVIGNENWPFPIPLVQHKGAWYFDTAAGRDEILLRRIGANELDAIAVARGYVEAQREFAETAHTSKGGREYAQHILSAPGTHDGLYWKNPDGTSGGPIGEEVARAIHQGYTPDRSSPYHGYFFKILKGQGPAAPHGAMNFVVNGDMIGGFALVAAPAEYRVTGVKTFIVSHNGVVYQKDLGPNTLKIFQKMEVYNPDKTWKPTEDEW
jgi:hypothetical protein